MALNHSSSFNSDDHHWLKLAVILAQRGLGLTAPNPSVGCVIVNQAQQVIGRGWTQKGGRPHAEQMALMQMGRIFDHISSGGHSDIITAYVTLEPCSHHGETPPCADALIKAKINRVIILDLDADTRVSGRGVKALNSAGVDVMLAPNNFRNDMIKQGLNPMPHAGHHLRITKQRPYITLKTALTIDGKTALSNGDSQWITCPEARNYGHYLRATHDAIMVGSGTTIHDNPQLDCRIRGLEEQSPIRVVLDRQLKTPLDFKIFQNTSSVYSPLNTWLITSTGATKDNPQYIETLQSRGQIKIMALDALGDEMLKDALAQLTEQGITRLLVEGGSRLHAHFIKQGLVDEWHVLTAPSVIGHDGRSAIDHLGIEKMDGLHKFKFKSQRKIGTDSLIIYGL